LGNEPGFWADKTVLVTGGGGFLGQHVAKKLKAVGCENVVAPSKDEYDLRERQQIVRLLKDTEPDLVIHLAAVVGGIGANRLHPGEYFYDNAIMGIELLEYARGLNVRKFVCLGTICAYQSSPYCRFAKQTCVMAIQRRPTQPTDWQRKCCWSRRRRTGRNTDSIVFICCP
jgi:nucleoside-diphosphate-sugar epimerase